MREESGANAQRGVNQRRRFTEEFRRQVVEETLRGNSSIAGVALRHGLNNNLVFKWRMKHLRARSEVPATAAKMLPVTLADKSGALPARASGPVTTNKPSHHTVRPGTIQIEWNGARIVLNGAVDAQSLQLVLAVLSSR